MVIASGFRLMVPGQVGSFIAVLFPQTRRCCLFHRAGVIIVLSRLNMAVPHMGPCVPFTLNQF